VFNDKRHLLQILIPGVMTKFVINLLEIINVNNYNTEYPVVALGNFALLFQFIADISPVVKPG
jgi:hypothetical protein